MMALGKPCLFSLLHLLLPTMLSFCKETKDELAFEIWKVLKSEHCNIVNKIIFQFLVLLKN